MRSAVFNNNGAAVGDGSVVRRFNVRSLGTTGMLGVIPRRSLREEAAKAHEAIESRGFFGKLVLRVG